MCCGLDTVDTECSKQVLCQAAYVPLIHSMLCLCLQGVYGAGKLALQFMMHVDVQVA